MRMPTSEEDPCATTTPCVTDVVIYPSRLEHTLGVTPNHLETLKCSRVRPLNCQMAQISLGDEVRWWGEPHLGTSIFWEQQKARSLPVPSYARVLGKREYVDLVPHWRFKLASMASLSIDGSAMQLRFNAVTLEVLCDDEAHEDALNQHAKALGHMVPTVLLPTSLVLASAAYGKSGGICNAGSAAR